MLLYGLLCEICSLPLRMGELCRRRLDLGVRIGPLLELSKNKLPTPCMSTHARTADMLALTRLYPYLTVVDWLPCSAAWERGFQFGVRQAEGRCCDTAPSISEYRTASPTPI